MEEMDYFEWSEHHKSEDGGIFHPVCAGTVPTGTHSKIRGTSVSDTGMYKEQSMPDADALLLDCLYFCTNPVFSPESESGRRRTACFLFECGIKGVLVYVTYTPLVE
jgi:hypothetical protein